jgi:hypothetical protein
MDIIDNSKSLHMNLEVSTSMVARNVLLEFLETPQILLHQIARPLVPLELTVMRRASKVWTVARSVRLEHMAKRKDSRLQRALEVV